MDLSLHCLYSVGVGHTGSFFFAMAILLLGGNLDDLVEIVTDTEWGEARLKFCYFSIKLVNMPVRCNGIV
jgi:hypothetical protein